MTKIRPFIVRQFFLQPFLLIGIRQEDFDNYFRQFAQRQEEFLVYYSDTQKTLKLYNSNNAPSFPQNFNI